MNVLPFQRLPAIEGVETSFEVLGAGPVDDITFTVRGGRAADGLALEIDSNPHLHDLTGTEAHADRLLEFLHRFADLDQPLARLQTVSPTEFERWVRGVNDTDHPVPDTTLVELFRQRAESSPTHPALVGERVLDYGRTRTEVVTFAGQLREGGASRGSVVAVYAERSVDRVIAYLAIMWLGAAYLPLDPEHPLDRNLRIAESAGAVGVVAPERHLPGAESLGVPTLGWPAVDAAQPTHSESPTLGWPAVDAAQPTHSESSSSTTARPDARPRDPAYLIYTSGSTGAPKGVVIEHRAIVNRLEWMRDTFSVDPDDRVLQKTPATFDVSVWELFLPLIAGATLVVAPPGVHRDPAELARLVRNETISALHFVPAMLGPFLDTPESEGLRIARVFTSGERLEAALRDRFHRRIAGQLHNLYGPTEAAVDVTHWPAPADDRSAPGVPGELHLAGRQLAREYLGRPDLTAERFVPDPFHPGERMYRTGDRARWRRDGALLFDGRLDRQVKVRGQRIELGEVEAALMGIEGISGAVAALPPDAAPGAGLVAWVTPTPDNSTDPDALRDALARTLPDAMVPSAITVLDAFPLTASGKVDHRSLPKPPAPAVGGGGAPRNETQRQVAELFARTLELDGTPGPTDDFFRLGGHSLAAIEVLTALRDTTGVALGPGALFATPTVGALAEVVESALRSPRNEPQIRSDPDTGLAPLLPLAPGPETHTAGTLYCIHPAGGIAWCYTALARELGDAVRMVGVQSPWLASSNAPTGAAPGPEPVCLDDLARCYLDRVLEAHPGGPIHLLGWSVGGIIAHAMACQMAHRGLQVGCLALLDAYPADYWHDQPDPGADAPLRALLLIAGEDPDRFDADALDRETVRRVLRERRHLLGSLSDEALDGVVRVVGLNNRLVRTHEHSRLEADVIHFRAALDHVDTDIDPAAWSAYVGAIESHPIPAIHPHMTGPAASARVAAVLEDRLARQAGERGAGG